jgi:hypothetical protein
MPGGRLPRAGSYPVRSWEDTSVAGPQFRALFVAGSAERPSGAFHGESGWVTITETGDGRISGEFEIRARGFVVADLADENRWVTVRGSFEAGGDSADALAQEAAWRAWRAM